MVKGYWDDPSYQLAQDSNNTSKGGKRQHYPLAMDGYMPPLVEERSTSTFRKDIVSTEKHLGN